MKSADYMPGSGLCWSSPGSGLWSGPVIDEVVQAAVPTVRRSTRRERRRVFIRDNPESGVGPV